MAETFTLPAGDRKVIYVDRDAMRDGLPAYVVRSAGQKWAASAVIGQVRMVQSEARLTPGGPHCWVETDGELEIVCGEPLLEAPLVSRAAAVPTPDEAHATLSSVTRGN